MDFTDGNGYSLSRVSFQKSKALLIKLIQLLGAASFGFAFVAMWILPDFPASTTGSAQWFFTQEERELAVTRIALDRVSQPKVDESVMHGLKLAVKDYRTWVFVSHFLDRTTP
jgi:hypothetical protein